MQGVRLPPPSESGWASGLKDTSKREWYGGPRDVTSLSLSAKKQKV